MLSRFLLYLRPQASVSESLSRSHFRIAGKTGLSRNLALYGKRQDD
jgi:hypothetical protein